MKRVNKTRLFALLFLLVAGGCSEAVVEEDDIPLHALKRSGCQVYPKCTGQPDSRYP